jgi:hypothetical protein
MVNHLCSRSATDTRTAWLYDHKTACQFLAVLFDKTDYILEELLLDGGRVSQKDNTAHFRAVSKDKLAEILVFSEEHSFFTDGTFDDIGIFCPGGDLSDREDIVAGFSQEADEAEITTLIRKKPHPISGAYFLEGAPESPKTTVSSWDKESAA